MIQLKVRGYIDIKFWSEKKRNYFIHPKLFFVLNHSRKKQQENVYLEPQEEISILPNLFCVLNLRAKQSEFYSLF